MGPFELVKAIRPIEPGQKGIIQVAFMPEVGGKYFTTMDLSHGKSKISVHLIAEAIQPDIQIEPLKELYMGDVCIGDTSTQKVKIKNNNPIQINCEFSMISEVDASIVGRDHGSLNFSGKSPFVCAVKRLSIEPNAVVEVDVKFQPDRDHDNFFDRLLIKAECLDDPLCIILTGKGWDTSTCITNCDSHPSSYSATCFTLGPAKEYENALKRHQKTAEDVAKEEPSVKYLWTMNYKTKHFATVTIPWAKVKGSDLLEQYPALDPNKEYWRIPPAEVILANWKPLFKLEAGKKASLTEFTVEEYDGTFYYDNVLKDYMLIYKSAKTHPKNGFEIELEPAKGTIDLGTTKPLQIVTKDPTRILWNQCYEAWSKLESTKPEPAPLSTVKKTPGDYLSCSMEVDDSQAEEFKRMANEMELADPVYMERVFKIKFKNSYRFVEPKGPHPPNETRVFYLKVKVEPPV
jgi:hypothetical protein